MVSLSLSLFLSLSVSLFSLLSSLFSLLSSLFSLLFSLLSSLFSLSSLLSPLFSLLGLLLGSGCCLSLLLRCRCGRGCRRRVLLRLVRRRLRLLGCKLSLSCATLAHFEEVHLLKRGNRLICLKARHYHSDAHHRHCEKLHSSVSLQDSPC